MDMKAKKLPPWLEKEEMPPAKGKKSPAKKLPTKGKKGKC